MVKQVLAGEGMKEGCQHEAGMGESKLLRRGGGGGVVDPWNSWKVKGKRGREEEGEKEEGRGEGEMGVT